MIHDHRVIQHRNEASAPWTRTVVFDAAIASLEANKVDVADGDKPYGYALLSGEGIMSGLVIPYGTEENTVCEGNDARLSDARVPMGDATGDLSGEYPAPTVAGLQGDALDATEPDGFIKRDYRNEVWESVPYGESRNTVLEGVQAERLESLERITRLLIYDLTNQRVRLLPELVQQIGYLEKTI